MDSSLKGKVVLITGAASGIGRATAIKLSKVGANLSLTDVNEAGLSETAALTDKSSDIIVAQLDVSDAARCELVVQETVQYFKRLDHVFNCAGINPTAYPILDLPAGYFDKLVDVNLKGVHNMTIAALPHMGEHVGCSFVNVSSCLGLKPEKEMAAYCATKYAVIGYSKALSMELGAKGVRVNIIAPGYIDTPTNASVIKGEAAIAQSAKAAALGRLGKADEVADLVAFLMSHEARYMTGSVVPVDGGMGI